MEKRRENPQVFDIKKVNPSTGGTSSEPQSSSEQGRTTKFRTKLPYVLDLRDFKKNKIIPRDNLEEILTKDIILRELASIDDSDIELASGLSIPLPNRRGEFFSKNSEPDLIRFVPPKTLRGFAPKLIPPKQKRASAEFSFRQIRNFIFVSGATAALLFGAFFVQKGLAVKKESMQKSIQAYENFLGAKQALRVLDFNSATKDFSKAYESLASVEQSLSEMGNITVSIVENLPFESKADSSISLLRAAKHMARAGEVLSSAFAALSLEDVVSVDVFLGMFLEQEDGLRVTSFFDIFSSFSDNLAYAETELTYAEQEMQGVDPGDFPEEFQSSIQDLDKKIPALLNVIRIAKEYSKISAVLLGVDTPKRYLILFQNSSELRPTGGFIGTYAIVEVDNGNVTDLFVEGIYSADGRLSVNIVPPKPFQHITTAWSTHDANWFLDFPTSAKKIIWFYEKTGGGEVDGVITLNVEVIEELLNLTGPIFLDEYDLTLDADSFRDEIQYEVEVAYDKKINLPKQVLSDFTPIFLSRLFEVTDQHNKEIISIIIRALEQKYVMFYFEDENVQEFFENQGWTGSIQIVNCLSPVALVKGGQAIDNCSQSDYLAVVHSNIGGYKTDKFMENKIDYSAEMQEDGSIIGRLSIRRKHNGGDSKYWWYNRKNIDYVKIYVPDGAQIISYSGGMRREPLSPPDYEAMNFVEDDDIASIEADMHTLGPIDIFKENDKTVFGTWLISKPKTTSIFEIHYKLPFGVNFENGVGKYNLYLQKQPGTKADATVSVITPDDWEIVWGNSQTNSLENSPVLSGVEAFILDTDKVMGYIFKKNF